MEGLNSCAFPASSPSALSGTAAVDRFPRSGDHVLPATSAAARDWLVLSGADAGFAGNGGLDVPCLAASAAAMASPARPRDALATASASESSGHGPWPKSWSAPVITAGPFCAMSRRCWRGVAGALPPRGVVATRCL